MFNISFILSRIYFLQQFLELNQKFGNKIPGGLVTKTTAPGYEMVHVGGSQGPPTNFVGTGQVNQLNQMGTGGYPGFPPNLALAGFNPAAFLQSSMYFLLIILFKFYVETFSPLGF